MYEDAYADRLHDLTGEDEIVLLDQPVSPIDADELIEAEVDESDVETEQIVLLDYQRIDDDDLDEVA
jgi:hypothetical protein